MKENIIIQPKFRKNVKDLLQIMKNYIVTTKTTKKTLFKIYRNLHNW